MIAGPYNILDGAARAITERDQRTAHTFLSEYQEWRHMGVSRRYAEYLPAMNHRFLTLVDLYQEAFGRSFL